MSCENHRVYEQLAALFVMCTQPRVYTQLAAFTFCENPVVTNKSIVSSVFQRHRFDKAHVFLAFSMCSKGLGMRLTYRLVLRKLPQAYLPSPSVAPIKMLWRFPERPRRPAVQGFARVPAAWARPASKIPGLLSRLLLACC